MTITRTLARLTFLALAAGTASAQTFLVDDTPGPGVDFAEIADALAVVPDSATLNVLTGVYSGFTVTRAVTIVGALGLSPEPRVQVSGDVNVDGTGIAGQVKLTRVKVLGSFYAMDVEEPLVLDAFQVVQQTNAVRCDDLRITRSFMEDRVDLLDGATSISGSIVAGYAYGSNFALRVAGTATVQIHASEVVGRNGFNCGPTPGCLSGGGNAGDGAGGLAVEAGASVRIVRSEVIGGSGGGALCGCTLDDPRVALLARLLTLCKPQGAALRHRAEATLARELHGYVS